jgi:hypothetical protein
MLKMAVVLLLLSLIAGAAIWLLENKKNREMFGGKFSKGFGQDHRYGRLDRNESTLHGPHALNLN